MTVGSVERERPEASESAASILLFGLLKVRASVWPRWGTRARLAAWALLPRFRRTSERSPHAIWLRRDDLQPSFHQPLLAALSRPSCAIRVAVQRESSSGVLATLRA